MRPSGVVTLVREILPHLSNKSNITINILSIKNKYEGSFYKYESSNIFKFSYINIVGFISKIKKINPDSIIIFSSISRGYLLFTWFYIITFGLKRKVMFYQCTNLRFHKHPSLIKLLLRRYEQIWVTNTILLNYFSNILTDSKIYKIFPSSNILPGYPRKYPKFKCVSFMGHWSFLKGTDVVLKIASHFPELKFKIIAGIGKEKADKQLHLNFIKSNRNSIKNIEYVGFTKDPLTHLKGSDILLLPYRSGISVLGVPQSAIEAMAFGIPVLSTSNAATIDIIKDGYNGFHCNTTEIFIDKIQELYLDNTLYGQLSAASIKTYRNYFQSKSTARNIWDLIQNG